MLNLTLMTELINQVENLSKDDRILLWNDHAAANNKPKILKLTTQNVVEALQNDLSLYLSSKCDERMRTNQYFSVLSSEKVGFFDYLDDDQSPYDDTKLASWLLKNDAMNKYHDWFDQSRLELCMQNSLSLSGIYLTSQESQTQISQALSQEPKLENFQTQHGFLTAWLKWADNDLLPNYYAA